MGPNGRGRTAAVADRAGSRRATWRSITAGFVVVALLVAATVAVDHPTATALGFSVLLGLLVLARRAGVERTLSLCGPRFCLQFRVALG